MAYINLDVSTMAMPSGMNRMGQFPLDMSSVYYDEASLKAYAESGAISYVGQIVSLVDVTNNKVTVYSIQDTAGTLKEVGTVPVGDGSTIVVDAEGKISLAGMDGLVFERDIVGEDGEPTGEKESVQYQALLTGSGLVWVEPSKTTVEGLATLIEGLDKRVTSLEGKVGKAAEGETAATGLYAEIATEKARAEAAEKALDDAIKAIDFVDEDELTEALSAKADKTVVDGMYTNAQIDELIQGAKDYADNNDANDNTTYTIGYEGKVEGEDGHPARIVLTPSVGEATYVDATPFIKDGMLDTVDYDADTNTLTFTFNTDAGKEEIPVELSDILAPYTGAEGDRIKVTVDGASISADLKANSIGKDYLDSAVKASLALADTAIQEHQSLDHLALKTDLNAYTTTNDLNTLLAGKQDTIAEGTYATPAQVATAKGEAISAAATDAEGKVKALADGAVATNAAAIEAINNAETGILAQAKADATQKANSAKAGAEATAASLYATKEFVGIIPNDSEGNAKGDSIVEYINIKAEETLKAAQGGSSETAASVAAALQNYKDLNDPKVAKNTSDITALTTKVNDEAAELDATQATLGEHGTEIGTLKTTVAGHGSTIDSHTQSLLSISGDLAKKAAQSDLEAAVVRIATNESDIKTLKETTVPAINEAIGLKANSADVYTKTEIGAIEEGKTLIDMINAAGDKSAIEARVKAIEDDYLVEADKTELAGLINGHESRIAAVEEFFTAADNKDETIENLAEIIAYINSDKSGAAEMAGNIQENADAIATLTQTVNDNKTAADNAVKAITDNYKVKNVDNTSLALDDNGVASVKAVSTDLLFNGVEELIFKAGDAGVKVVE